MTQPEDEQKSDTAHKCQSKQDTLCAVTIPGLGADPQDLHRCSNKTHEHSQQHYSQRLVGKDSQTNIQNVDGPQKGVYLATKGMPR